MEGPLRGNPTSMQGPLRETRDREAEPLRTSTPFMLIE
jgi:hypothetical protein